MSITTYEFLSVLQAQDNVETGSSKNSFDYMTVLNSVRSTIAQNHAAELAAALNDIKAAQTLKNLVLKYAAECMAGKDYDRDELVERIYQDMAGLGIPVLPFLHIWMPAVQPQDSRPPITMLRPMFLRRAITVMR